MKKASRAALEKQNPELASAVTKIERSGAAPNDPLAAQRAMSKLTAAERRAYLEAAGEQGPGPSNRAERRRLERARRRSRYRAFAPASKLVMKATWIGRNRRSGSPDAAG